MNYGPNIIDLNVPMASEHVKKPREKTIWHDAWTPEDPKLFYFGGFNTKDIDICFLGTFHSFIRVEFLKFLENNIKKDKNYLFSGGQRQNALSPEKYAELTRRTKIMLNFSYSPNGNHQVKGRVFEATSSGCLLLESKNELTNYFYEPNKEYIEFVNKEDCLDKILYFFKDENKEEREKISLNGLKKFNENYTNNHFWNKLFKEIE